jgi:predicted negative regulator of RcsB-dependent stress response
MKFRLTIFRDYLDRILPSKTFRFYLSKSGIAILFLIIIIVSVIFYYRSYEKEELEILKKEHKKIQLSIESYLRELSSIEINSENGKFLNKKLNEYRKRLSIMEEEIITKKRIWFLE